MRPRPGGVNRARSEDKPRPDRDPEPVRPRRQGHGDSLAVCVMRLAPATMGEMAIAMTTRITRCFDALRRAGELGLVADRKSTRLNSSHVAISYAVFCLKKKKSNHSG